jgi:hypothetical protein
MNPGYRSRFTFRSRPSARNTKPRSMSPAARPRGSLVPVTGVAVVCTCATTIAGDGAAVAATAWTSLVAGSTGTSVGTGVAYAVGAGVAPAVGAGVAVYSGVAVGVAAGVSVYAGVAVGVAVYVGAGVAV